MMDWGTIYLKHDNNMLLTKNVQYIEKHYLSLYGKHMKKIFNNNVISKTYIDYPLP